MRILKRHLATVLVGTLGVAGLSFAGALALTAPTDDVVLAQDGAQGRDRPDRPMHRPAIRGDLVVPGEEEGTFRNVRLDRGVIEGVDGTTVVIKEADGTVVEIPTSDETRIARDGESAEVSDLKTGDHAFAIRIDEGEGLVTRSVRAVSPERWAGMEQRREECRADPQRCRAQHRRPFGRPGGSGTA